MTVRPLDVEVEGSNGAAIMSRAQAHGYFWPTTCGGEGRCTACACVVLSVIDHFSPRGRSEGRRQFRTRTERH